MSNLSDRDALLIFSVGGGNREKGVSPNLVSALEYAKEIGARVLGIVGRDGGYTAKVADACLIECLRSTLSMLHRILKPSKLSFGTVSSPIPSLRSKRRNGSRFADAGRILRS